MNRLRSVYDSLRRQKPLHDEKHISYNDTRLLNKNIYEGKTLGGLAKRFDWVHTVLKYKIIVPFLLIVERIVRKRLEHGVPDLPQNRDLRIFEKAFDLAQEKWTADYLRNLEREQQVKRRYWWSRRVQAKDPENMNNRLLQSAKKSVLTVALYDTVYREFLNILVHEIALEYNRVYSVEKKQHLLYGSDGVDDHAYFVLWKELRGDGVFVRVRDSRFRREFVLQRGEGG